MFKNLLVIANCVAIVASIFGFGFVLLHLWKGIPIDPNQRRSQAKKGFMLSVFFALLLIFLSLRLTNVIQLYSQEGLLKEYPVGETEIHYKAHYKFPPNLDFVKVIKSDRSTTCPKVSEQRNDGFKVIIDLDSYMYKWKAEGVIKSDQ